VNSASPDFEHDPGLSFLQGLWKLNHALELRSAMMEREMGVTAQQRFGLRCIHTFPGMTAGQLARVLHLDPGTVSATLRRLEGQAFLERKRDPADRRRVILRLTGRGRAIARPRVGTVESAVVRLLESTSPRDIAMAREVLHRLTEALGDVSPNRGK
jgi:DNA-binding MarR family transcriptional regulator